MNSFRKHLINGSAVIKEALLELNNLAIDSILFVTDSQEKLVGSLTDGDVRRGFLRGLNFENQVKDFVQPNPKFIQKSNYSIETILDYRSRNFRIIPVLDDQGRIIDIVNFRLQKSYLPVDAVVMAGGRGERLKPLTDSQPKPLLKVGDKTIIEHNLDRLAAYGVDDIWISLRYLGEQIQEHLGTGDQREISIQYVWEKEPLGTIGSVRSIDNFPHEYVLITNSDILTNLDYEDLFISFLKSGADLSVVTIPYEVRVPYAVLETSNGHVISFKEKPTFTYYSNGGIYLMKKDVVKLVPKGCFYNATDLMEQMIEVGMKVHSYPLHGYWLDIGRMEDYTKAQEDIQHLKL